MALVDNRTMKPILMAGGGAIALLLTVVLLAGGDDDARDAGSRGSTTTTTEAGVTDTTQSKLPFVPPGAGADPEHEHENDGEAEISPYDSWRSLLQTDIPKGEVYARISDPTGSDINPQTFRTSTDFARRFLTADMTGQGREAFGTYWDGANQQAMSKGYAARNINIVASGCSAFSQTAVRCLLVYSGTASDGSEIPESISTILMRGDGFRFTPYKPWEYPDGAVDIQPRH